MGDQPKWLMVMAGGIGGHMFPGLAVAHHLMAQGWRVHWLGIADRMEADLVPKYDIEIDLVRISGLRGKGVNALLTAPVRISNVWRQVCVIMRQFKPDVVLGMGDCVPGPGGLAAWSLGIPVILHEQNGTAGSANKRLTKVTTKMMQASPGAFPNAEVVGNLIRIGVLVLPLPEARLAGREGPARVLVVGGFQGARVLNQAMSQVVAKLGDAVTIWRRGGKGVQQTAEQAYADAERSQHKVTEFIDNMAVAHARADVVACRSSTLTVSEIAAAGLPASFVPFQHKDRQQYWNALPLEKAGAARILKQPQFTIGTAANTLFGWSRETLLTMIECARAASIPDTTGRVVDKMGRAARTQLW